MANINAVVEVRRFEKEFDSPVVWTKEYFISSTGFSKSEARWNAKRAAEERAQEDYGRRLGCWCTRIIYEQFNR